METRKDSLLSLELEDLANEFYRGEKPIYRFTVDGEEKFTGCARCAAMFDDSAVYGEHERENVETHDAHG